jgi:hypothetical protein
MKTLTIILMICLSGCTYAKFNRDSNEFTFISTKEFDAFDVTFRDGDKEFSVYAEQVRAFEGQKGLVKGVAEAVKPGPDLEGLF